MTESINLEEIALSICKNENLSMIEKVGEGSYKETFNVVDVSSAQYALKIYKSTDFDERSRREITAMVRCDHPSIAKILSLNIYATNDSSFLYIIEEFYRGGTLEDYFKKSGKLKKSEIIKIGLHLINAISHLSDLDLVHRDIKPANILFNDDTIPVITDFGIVRDLKAISETQSWFLRGPGTPLFATPEQLNNDKKLIDWRTDQFSLGITLALCSFGQHPYMHTSFSPERTVEEVTLRGSTSKYFKKSVKKSSMLALPKMVAPWPVERYLKPEQLIEDWNKYGG